MDIHIARDGRGGWRHNAAGVASPKPRVSDEGVAPERHPGYQSARKPERYRRSIPERRTPRESPVNQKGDGARWNGTPSAFGRRGPAHPGVGLRDLRPRKPALGFGMQRLQRMKSPAMQRLRRCKPICNATPVALCSCLWYCFIVCWRPKTAQLQRPGVGGGVGNSRACHRSPVRHRSTDTRSDPPKRLLEKSLRCASEMLINGPVSVGHHKGRWRLPVTRGSVASPSLPPRRGRSRSCPAGRRLST